MTDTGLLTASEVASLAKVSARTVSRWARSGKLTAAHKLPGATGALLFSRDDIDRFLDDGQDAA